MQWSSTSFPNETGLYLRFADGQSLDAEDILRDRIHAFERTFSRDAGGSPDCGAERRLPDRASAGADFSCRRVPIRNTAEVVRRRRHPT
jgi:hypothetical protein